MVKQKGNKKHNRKDGNNKNDDDSDYQQPRQSSKQKGGKQQQQSSSSSTSSPKRRRKRNMNVLSADDFKLRQEIESGGKLTIIDIEADGNCLFRSISDQLYYDYGANHYEIRDEICNYIEEHRDDFSCFLVLDDKDAGENEEDASDFDTYVANMRQDGDWGGHLELVAATKIYRRNVTVFSARLEKLSIEHGSPKGSCGPDLLLSYHDNDHYNSVRVSSVTKPPPPIRVWTSSLQRVTPIDADENNNDVDGIEMAIGETTITRGPTVSPAPTVEVEMVETEAYKMEECNRQILNHEKLDCPVENLASSVLETAITATTNDIGVEVSHESFVTSYNNPNNEPSVVVDGTVPAVVPS